MNIENTIALIIPIHPPKFRFIYNLKNKLNIINKCCDIFLVFSNENEYNEFICKDDFKTIILPPTYKTKNIVTFKKFYALNILKKKYSYYILPDSEIDIIDENFTHENIIMKINEFYNSKNIFAGQEVHICKNNITKISCDIFKSNNDKNKLKKLTNNYKLYYWWSDLPIYKASHLDDFFSKINYDTIFVWHHFDHKIYLNYLVLYYNFKFINISSIIGRSMSLESYCDNNINNLKILKKYFYTFSWIIPTLFNKHKIILL